MLRSPLLGLLHSRRVKYLAFHYHINGIKCYFKFNCTLTYVYHIHFTELGSITYEYESVRAPERTEWKHDIKTWYTCGNCCLHKITNKQRSTIKPSAYTQTHYTTSPALYYNADEETTVLPTLWQVSLCTNTKLFPRRSWTQATCDPSCQLLRRDNTLNGAAIV